MSDASAQSRSPRPPTRVPDGFDLQGHRGARGLVPENTIPAFRRALELGVTTLEMDVVVSADGAVVVSHEPWMAREKCLAPDGSPIPADEARAHRIYEMSYEQIAAYDCGRTLEAFPEQERVSAPKPRLREVLEMAEAYVDAHDRGPVFYNIETKSRPEWDGTLHPEPETFVRRVLAVVTAADVAPRTTIQSFDPRTLEVTRRQNATVRTALLVGGAGTQGLDDNLAALSFVPDIYSPNAQLVDDALVSAVHDRGLLLIPWTVNAPDAMARLLRLGVDGLITDYPNRAREVLDAAP
ncbi:MAG: glycerophosphodiester phosphodiesterase family protein [Salinibacter sp.]